MFRWREGAETARRALRLSLWDLSSAIYDGVAAYAAYVEGRLRRGDPATARGHPSAQRLRRHTAAAAMAGEMDLAKAMLQELRRAQPNISLAWMASHLPFRRDEREHFMEGLRRGGVPSVGLPQVQGGRNTIRTGFNNRRENTNHWHAITRLGCGCFGSAYRAAADPALRLIQHHLAEPDHDPRRRAFLAFACLVCRLLRRGDLGVIISILKSTLQLREQQRPRPWGNRGVVNSHESALRQRGVDQTHAPP